MKKKPLYLIEDDIKPGDYVSTVNGEVFTVRKYDSDKHLITFTNGKVRDLYVIYDDFVTDIWHPRSKINDNESQSSTKKNASSKRDISLSKKKTFSLYGLASGKPGKKFTIKSFLQITKDAKKKPSGANTDKTIKLDDGYVYQADSQQEISTIKKLIYHDAFKRLRGQCINIPYKFGGKTHNYYPDFVILTQTNKIIIMEVKEVAQMSSKQNIRKYEALKRYCNKKGYLYIMCDKAFRPYEKLSKYSVNGKVENAIKSALKKKGYFDYSDYRDLIDEEEYKKVKSYRESIGVFLVKNKNKVKMVGDLTFKSSEFRIIKVKKK